MALNGTDKLVLLVSLILTLIIRARQTRRRLPLPPGPKPLPLLGNILDLPTKYEWETYRKWSTDYNSDIIYFTGGGNEFILLNDFESANELLDKRSWNYSSRPQFTMVSELMGWDWMFSGMVYGEPWRERRRLMHKYFNTRNSDFYQPTEIEFTRKMMPLLYQDPKEFLKITRQGMAGMTLSLAFGMDLKIGDDPLITLAQDAVQSISDAVIPGAFLVDVMPWLKYIPEWVPGAGFQKKAREWKALQHRFHTEPFNMAYEKLKTGNLRHSFLSLCLENIEGRSDAEHQKQVVMDLAPLVFAAGSDTTLMNVHTLFLALVFNPTAQKKAQEELDRVLGGRLPEFSDVPDLPYIDAIVKEIIRWQPATPIGVPHLASEEDIYKGYHIPKNAIMIANSWAMLHNERDYPDADKFNPCRFMKDGKPNPDVRDPFLMAFGFGRRVCPGRQLAYTMVWMFVATFISLFNVEEAEDENGNKITPSGEYYSGLMRKPVPFQCKIKPRSKEAEDTLKRMADTN
ncbi:cytochrome P450 [Panaeolus papilionaceus]|nr:cytochrome P450 [Panaeolus papilionaceus]